MNQQASLFLEASAWDTARSVVARACPGCQNREALVAEVARLVLAGLEAGVTLYMREHLLPVSN